MPAAAAAAAAAARELLVNGRPPRQASPPSSSASTSTSVSSHHEPRDHGYCCGLFAPVDVEDFSARPGSTQHHNHDHSTDTDTDTNANTFWTWPLFGPLLFDNESSDCRDHAANERTFLSYLRLSVYMAVVAVAITLSFHLKSRPTDLELRMARPLGFIFWLLAVACLALGFANYINTLNKYGRRDAIVQTGWRTQSVMSLIGLTIVGTCIVLLVVAKVQVDLECDSLVFPTDARCAARLRHVLSAQYSRLGGGGGSGGDASLFSWW